MNHLLLIPVSLALSVTMFAGQLDDAVSAFERGDFASAESMVRVVLKTSPANASALGLLGAVLDSEKRYSEAEQAYRRAITLTPASATLLNNYANHQLTTGDRAGARATYLKVIAADPERANANLQLAQFAIDDKNGRSALMYLQHLPAAALTEPQVQIVQLQALYLARHNEEAAALLSRMLTSPDPRLSFSGGLALAGISRYGEAEQLFSRALELAPGNFDVLYNLGLASFHAGHLPASRKALDAALSQRPQNVDVLFNLAAVNVAGNQQASALQLLSQASKLDPSRADVQLVLAQTASALGYYADARLAYERYLKLHPNDSAAEREHLFMVALSEQPREGLASLKSFTRAHPEDVAAHYEVGVLEAKVDPDHARAEFEDALRLQPGYTPARLGRGTLNYLQGKSADALPDLEFAASEYPQNAAVLDRLGEVYSALDRPREAVAALNRASSLAPRDSRILMHLSRAEAKAGDNEAARTTLAHFRALGPQPGNLIPQAGVVDFLALPTDQQQARYAEEVARRVQEHPDDPDLNKRYLEVLLSQNRSSELPPVVRRLIDAHPPVPVAVDAGEALVSAGDYAEARPLLEYALQQSPNTQRADLGLVIVDLHTAGPATAIARLQRIPQSASSGDLFLAKGIVAEAAGQHAAAKAAFTQAATIKPNTAFLYREAVQVLLQNNENEEAMLLVKSIGDRAQADTLRASLGM